MNYPFVILCLLILGALGWRICVNARRLQKRIEEFHEEQASNPMDFYIAMNEL